MKRILVVALAGFALACGGGGSSSSSGGSGSGSTGGNGSSGGSSGGMSGSYSCTSQSFGHCINHGNDDCVDFLTQAGYSSASTNQSCGTDESYAATACASASGETLVGSCVEASQNQIERFYSPSNSVQGLVLLCKSLGGQCCDASNQPVSCDDLH